MTKDLTNGNPTRLVLGFSLPLLLGFLFQQFYNLVDTVIVGKVLGPDSLAAVGATGSVNFLVIGFCMGVCTGFSIPVSHKFGAGDQVGLRKYVANCVWLGIAFAIGMTLLTTFLCRNILIWMKTPGDIIDGSYEYIFVIFAGIPTVFLYNLCSGIIRSLGDSKTPVYFLLLSSFLNIGLDLLLMITFQMGVQGAALATVISQGVSGVLCLLYMIKKFDILRIRRNEWRMDGHMMSVLCGMGVPMGLQYSITAIGGVILQTATNGLGTEAVAAVTCASRVSGFLACPFDALGSTMATWAGQNVGAGKLERVKTGLRSASLIGSAYALMALVAVLLFGDKMGMLFLDAEEFAILSNVKLCLIWNAAFYVPLCLVNTIRFCIQGMGFPTFAILAGVFEMVARGGAGVLLVPILGFTGVCMGGPLAWILADSFLIPAFFHSYGVLKKHLDRGESVEKV